MIRKFSALAPVILFKRSSVKQIMEMDIHRWVHIHNPDRSAKSPAENFAWLLETYPEFRNLFYYRIGTYSSILGRILLWLAKMLYPPVDTMRFGLSKIGPGFFIEHGFVTIIGAETIGENCWVNSGVAIGYRDQSGVPNIGNNVYIGAGAKILGPVKIGDNVVIGANAVVLRDVPSNCTVAGVPARIIRRDGVKVKESLSAATRQAS